MRKKRDLFNDLDIKELHDDAETSLYIDVENIKNRVGAQIFSAYPERKSGKMRSSKKRISVIAAAAILVLGATVFAAGGFAVIWNSSSSAAPDYTSLPSNEQVVEDIGYEAVLIEAFDNGYEFKNGNIVNNNLKDEDGNSVEKFRSLSFEYEKDGDIVVFSQDKFNSQLSEEPGEVVSSVNGTDIYYYSYTNKLVPPDYEMTDEDKDAETNGKLVFSWGSSKVEISEVQSVTWTVDGVQYQLLQIDGGLSADDLADMAEEIINR